MATASVIGADTESSKEATIDEQETLREGLLQSTNLPGQYGTISVAGNANTKELKTRRQRYFSLLVIMLNLLISSLCSSLIYGSLWPYYEKIDDSASESFLGVIIAGYSLGRLIFSPPLGVWSNHRPVSEPLIFSFIVLIFSHLLYVLAGTFKDIGKWMLLASKFVSGAGSAHIAVLRSYCSAASTEDERNTVMSFLTALHVLGNSLGPGFGLLFQPLGEDGYEWHDANLYFNLYTGPGFLGMSLLIINIVLTVFFFKEFDVHNTKKIIPLRRICCCLCYSDGKNNDGNGGQAKETKKNNKRYDRVAAIVCIFLYFHILSTLALQEAILPLLAQDEFAWSNKEVVLYVHIIISGITFLGAVMVVGTKYLVQCVSERKLLIGALLTMIVGLVIWMPNGPGHADVEIIVLNNSTSHHPLVQNASGDGCDVLEKSWCKHLPKIHLAQFVTGAVAVAIGRSASNLLCFTIYSKILGPWPQGLMMGLLAASGSFGRILAPTVLAKVYNAEGPRITFLISIGMMLIGLITTVAFYSRLIPYSVYEQKKGYIPVNSDPVNSEDSIETSMPHFTNEYQNGVSINNCDGFVQPQK